MRLCHYCRGALHPRNPSDRCKACRRLYHCKDCGKAKQDVTKTRCDACRKKVQSYTLGVHGVHRPGPGPETPAHVALRIRVYARLVELGLPLFEP